MNTHDAIDCDIHLPVPGVKTLLPYFDDYWRDMITARGIDRLDLACMPQSPISSRPDWRPTAGKTRDLEMLRNQLLDPWRLRIAICNCLHGAMALHSEDLGSTIIRAVNDWVAQHWLDRDPRLRASIIVHAENPAFAVEEIERRAEDRRFVQVLMLAMQKIPLGKRINWPIYEAAERLRLPIGIHAGSLYRNPPTGIGWPSYYVDDLVNQSVGFQGQLMSLVTEGVFSKFPNLTVVMMESGVTWLPSFMWRLDKTWRGTRTETPWLDRPPSEIIRRNVRFTVQPLDDPPQIEQFKKMIDQIGSDEMLLFSTDYPHWRFEGTEALPPGLTNLAQRIMINNPIATYPRLKETLQ